MIEKKFSARRNIIALYTHPSSLPTARWCTAAVFSAKYDLPVPKPSHCFRPPLKWHDTCRDRLSVERKSGESLTIIPRLTVVARKRVDAVASVESTVRRHRRGISGISSACMHCWSSLWYD